MPLQPGTPYSNTTSHSLTHSNKTPTQMKQAFQDRTPPNKPDIKYPTVPEKRSDTEKMKAVVFHGKKDVRYEEVPKVMITDPTDAIVRITASSICGTDLHSYHRAGGFLMKKGGIMGHESIGIVEEVGPEVKNIKKGERVVVGATLRCMNCEYCDKHLYNLCDCTNPKPISEQMYGHRTCGVLGVAEPFGGYAGTQAEFVRVPLADNNLYRLPESVSDKSGILLSDILPTAEHACQLAEVVSGDKVAIFGSGPVGLLVAYLCHKRGASQIVVVDHIKERLELAQKYIPCQTINYSDQHVVKTIQEMVPGGPDVVIDCTGFRFTKDLTHKIQQKLRLETDAPDTIDEMASVCKKGGRMALIAEYAGYSNSFPIGIIMSKQIQLRCGVVNFGEYVEDLIQKVAKGDLAVEFVFTHTAPISEATKMYKNFDEYKDGTVKIHFTVP